MAVRRAFTTAMTPSRSIRMIYIIILMILTIQTISVV